MNETVGTYSLSLLCLRSHISQSTSPKLWRANRCLKQKKRKCVFRVDMRTFVWSNMRMCTRQRNRPIPQTRSVLDHVLCTFSAKPIRCLLLCCQILFFLYGNDSWGCSLFAIHKDEVAHRGKWTCVDSDPSGCGTCRPYINTSSNALPAELFITEQSPAERSNRRRLRWQFPQGGSDQ